MAQFKVLRQHLPGGSKENYENSLLICVCSSHVLLHELVNMSSDIYVAGVF